MTWSGIPGDHRVGVAPLGERADEPLEHGQDLVLHARPGMEVATVAVWPAAATRAGATASSVTGSRVAWRGGIANAALTGRRGGWSSS
jgi:hypothetical protein